jgi:hypothetical protein
MKWPKWQPLQTVTVVYIELYIWYVQNSSEAMWKVCWSWKGPLCHHKCAGRIRSFDVDRVVTAVWGCDVVLRALVGTATYCTVAGVAKATLVAWSLCGGRQKLPGLWAWLLESCGGCVGVGVVKRWLLRWVDVIADWLMWSLMTAGWELCLLYQSRWTEPRLVVAAVRADWSAKGAECDWLSSAGSNAEQNVIG